MDWPLVVLVLAAGLFVGAAVVWVVDHERRHRRELRALAPGETASGERHREVSQVDWYQLVAQAEREGITVTEAFHRAVRLYVDRDPGSGST